MKFEISLYPFCGSLFTSSYEYTDLARGRCYSPLKNELTISFSIKNIGDHEGIEVAQLVFHEMNQNLKSKRIPGFSKVSLKPGESKNVKFVFSPGDYVNKSHTDNAQLEVIAGGLKRKFSIQTETLIN
jgi:beta-glucosidase